MAERYVLFSPSLSPSFLSSSGEPDKFLKCSLGLQKPTSIPVIVMIKIVIMILYFFFNTSV